MNSPFTYATYYGLNADNNSVYTDEPDTMSWYANISNDNKTVAINNFNDRIDWSFYGGKGVNAKVEGYTLNLNKVVLKKASDNNFFAYGGDAVYNSVKNNTVNVENNSVLRDVYGGRSGGENADLNVVKISDSEILGNVYGGRSNSKSANSNTVEITNGKIENENYGMVYGGYVSNGANVISNNVTVTKSVVNDIYGGYVEERRSGNQIWSASDDVDSAKENIVTLIDTTAKNVYGGRGKIVSGNKIFLNKSIVQNNLSGADTISTTVNDNELILISAENKAKNVSNFDIVRFGNSNKLLWIKDKTIFQTETFLGENIKLDLSNISLPDNFSEENIGEQMTLIDVKNTANLSNFNLQNGVFADVNSFELTNFKSYDIDVNYTPMHYIFTEETKIIDKIKGKVNGVVFKNIPWTETSPLIEKDENFDYENATVNTANINFTNVDKLAKNDKMILIESFGNTNDIIGDTYKIKTTLEGRGKAKIDDNKNLIFTIESEAKKDEPKAEIIEDTNDDNNDDYDGGYDEPVEEIKPKNEIKKEETKPKEEIKKEEIKPKEDIKEEVKEENIPSNISEQKIQDNEENSKNEITPSVTTQEQTHNTVMSMEAAMVALSSAGDFVQTAMEGIADGAKESEDGVATYAGMGGGASKTKTGSSVNANTWSAILALGQERKLKKGTFSYGGFFEYGRANYTIEPDNGMSGASKYVGGGVFIKWRNARNAYIEGSFRAGKMKDSAAGILTDSAGNRYGYDVSSNYIGAHIGVGKIYNYKNDNELDLYGKFFYTRRGGVSYEAGGFYDLDAVSSKILKLGCRYGKNKIGWNSYIGASYAYEFDGVASGKADGYAIREARVTGGTLTGEIGLRLKPSATSKWKSDISIKAHTGRSRGFGGHISLAYLF